MRLISGPNHVGDSGLARSGAVFSVSGGSKRTSRVQQSEPWAPQAEHLIETFQRAAALAAKPMTYYPGQTYAGPSVETELALDRQAARSRSGSPLTAAAQDELSRTLSGEYLRAGNPHLSAMMDRVSAEVSPRVNASFAAGGRFGSGAHARALSSALAEAGANLGYQDYGRERDAMMQAMLFAPQMASQDYIDIAKLAEVGAAREGFTQKAIDEAVARHEFAQMEPWQRLQLYSDLIQGNFGGTTTEKTKSRDRSFDVNLLDVGKAFGLF